MLRLLAWFDIHRRAVLVLAVAYFVVTTLGHDLAQEAAFWAQDKLGRDRWNNLNQYVGVLGVIVLCAWCVPILRRCSHPWVALMVGGITTMCAIAAFNTLFVMNVEMIHFPQYALMALLVYPLTKRFGETVVITAMLGAIDEGYQYLVLHRHWNTYFDLNDVTLNLLGAGFGVMLVFLAVATRADSAARPVYTVRRWITSPATIALGIVVLVGIVGACIGLVSVLPNDGAWLVLRRCGPPGEFWVVTDWGKRYHVLQPGIALALWIPLLALFHLLDFVRSTPKPETHSEPEA